MLLQHYGLPVIVALNHLGGDSALPYVGGEHVCVDRASGRGVAGIITSWNAFLIGGSRALCACGSGRPTAMFRCTPPAFPHTVRGHFDDRAASTSNPNCHSSYGPKGLAIFPDCGTIILGTMPEVFSFFGEHTKAE